MSNSNLDISFEPRGELYRVHAWSSAGEEADAEVRFSLTQGDIDDLVNRLDQPEMRSSGEGMRVGRVLFETLFAGTVEDIYRSALRAAEQKRKGLRIRLRLTGAPELAAFPWEFLYDPAYRRFLAQSDHTPIVRYLELPRPPRPIPVKPPLHVLVAVPDVRSHTRFDHRGELRGLSHALRKLGSSMIDYHVLRRATLQALQEHARQRRDFYHVFHFIGHGSFDEGNRQGAVMFRDQRGEGIWVSGTELGTHLHNVRSLRLAVLNSCEGAQADITDTLSGAGPNLVLQGIPAVVAMQFEITDDAAIAFCRAFYGAVIDGCAIDTAMGQARLALASDRRDGGYGLEWGAPVLYLRAPDARVFRLEKPKKPKKPKRPKKPVGRIGRRARVLHEQLAWLRQTIDTLTQMSETIKIAWTLEATDSSEHDRGQTWHQVNQQYMGLPKVLSDAELLGSERTIDAISRLVDQFDAVSDRTEGFDERELAANRNRVRKLTESLEEANKVLRSEWRRLRGVTS